MISFLPQHMFMMQFDSVVGGRLFLKGVGGGDKKQVPRGRGYAIVVVGIV